MDGALVFEVNGGASNELEPLIARFHELKLPLPLVALITRKVKRQLFCTGSQPFSFPFANRQPL